MKKLHLDNASYRYLEQSFKEWLDIQGYAESTVYNLPNLVREFLHTLEKQEIKHIKDLDIKHIKAYYQKLKERSNQRRGGGLSNGHLNKHLQALRKFTEYLREVGRLELPSLSLDNEEASQRLVYLTEEEIQLLFKTTYQYPDPKPSLSDDQIAALQSRDRAMMAIYYGCGLRRTEGISLTVSDIDFDRGVLHVRKGKNNTERLVPISKASLKHLQEYVYDHRPNLRLTSKTERLFLSYRGSPLGGQSLGLRLKALQYKSGELDLIEKEIGLHTLRHSIATHLLAAGMKLDSISKFLGHNSLESTQIYTHLMSEKQPFSNIPKPACRSGKYETGQLHEDEI